MTVRGTLSATAVLLVLFMSAATFGWLNVDVAPDGTIAFPPLTTISMIVGFGAVIAAMFKPKLAVVFGPVYAVTYGYTVGAISKLFDITYDGIVVQAVGATIAVAVVMLTLYRTGIVKVTGRFRRIVIVATFGVMLFYLASFVASLFGASTSLMSSASPLSIAISVGVSLLAAANLMLDFDNIDRGVAAGMPKHFEWVAALGLVVTLVWLYVELLRLFAKLRN